MKISSPEGADRVDAFQAEIEGLKGFVETASPLDPEVARSLLCLPSEVREQIVAAAESGVELSDESQQNRTGWLDRSITNPAIIPLMTDTAREVRPVGYGSSARPKLSGVMVGKDIPSPKK